MTGIWWSSCRSSAISWSSSAVRASARASTGCSTAPECCGRSAADRPSRRRDVAVRAGGACRPRNTLDRATAMLPRLLYERLDELGIDVAVLYPTFGLTVMALDDDELRRAIAACVQPLLRGGVRPVLAIGLLPVAVIPTYTPDEAIAELDHAVGELGLQGGPASAGSCCGPRPGHDGDRAARWVDGLGLDCAYDYDPLWQRCVELGVSPTFHSTGIGLRQPHVADQLRRQPHRQLRRPPPRPCARSLFFGGVTTRFPDLRFAFHEGGVAWAATLYADILVALGEAQPRRHRALRPGAPRPRAARAAGRASTVPTAFTRPARPARRDARLPQRSGRGPRHASTSSRRAASTVPTTSRRIFTEQYFFGCEADDPMNALAFDARRNAYGARLSGGVRVGHRSLGRPRLPRGARRGVGARRGRSHHRSRLPRLHVHEPGPTLVGHQSRLLPRHGGRERPRLTAGTLRVWPTRRSSPSSRCRSWTSSTPARCA